MRSFDLIAATTTFGSVHGLLHSTAFDVARNIVTVLAVVFWLGLAFWVYRDAKRRIDDTWLVGTATALGLVVPYLGALIYLLFRPPETLDDVHARTVELKALEESLGRRAPHCPVCRADVDSRFLICPVCTTQLKQPCAHCSAALEPSWQACPYCATPVISAPDLDAALTAEAANSTVTKSRPKPRPRTAKPRPARR